MERDNSPNISEGYSEHDRLLDHYEVNRTLELCSTLDQTVNHVRVDWERRRRLCIAQVVCYIVHMLYLVNSLSNNIHKRISPGSPTGDHVRHQLMRQLLQTEKQCRDVIRMSPSAFGQLCAKLRGTGFVKDSVRATVEEQVAQFLHILAHNVKNRTVSFFFRRSGEMISRHFHNVLQAVISLEQEFLVQPSGEEVPPQIVDNSRYYPHFKDCIGAIDGTHIRVRVPRADATRFRGRKQWPTQNVLAACNFAMNFTYVLAGWEGTAPDSRILKDALRRDEKLNIVRGKFYLGDAGFQLKRGLLTPYRGVRYHLKEYSSRAPQNPKELFNHRHASLPKVIERAFGVLKKRFPIVASGTEPHYPFQTMTRIVIACCILHNFLMREDPDDHLLAEVDRELHGSVPIASDDRVVQSQDEDYMQGCILRDNIAAQMWADYERHP